MDANQAMTNGHAVRDPGTRSGMGGTFVTVDCVMDTGQRPNRMTPHSRVQIDDSGTLDRDGRL